MCFSKKIISLMLTVFTLCVFCFVDFASTKTYAMTGFSYPTVVPTEPETDWKTWKKDNGSEYSDLVGVYYAEGLGLEIKITPRILKGNYSEQTKTGYLLDDDGNVCFGIDLLNYNSGEYLVYKSDNILKKESKNKYVADVNGCKITLTTTKKTKNGYKLNVEFSDEIIQKWNENNLTALYKSVSSAEFKDVAILEKKPADDNFGGSYSTEYDVYSDEERVYSIKQLYGTNDYYYVMYTLKYGEETSRYDSLYTAKDDLLVHEYSWDVPQGENKYAVHTIVNHGVRRGFTDESGKLGGFYSTVGESRLSEMNLDSPDFYAYEVADKTIWELSGDGIIY